MEDFLSLNNIMDSDDTLFEKDNESTEETLDNNQEDTTKKEVKTTDEVNPDAIFSDGITEEPESVVSEDNNKSKEDTLSSSEQGSSRSSFFSSVAKALADEGVLPEISDEDSGKISSASDFRDLIEQKIKSELDERQKRIDEALNYGVELSDISKYENTLKYLDNITTEALEEESDNGDSLRRTIIYQDYINKGFSKEKAEREVTKAFNAGTDLEDAKEALENNKNYFKSQYNELIKESKQKIEDSKKEEKERINNITKSIKEDKTLFGGLDLDNATRQKIVDSVIKPIYKDENGIYYNAIQKYERENKEDFIKNLAIVFTLTNGFKDFNKIIRSKVNKEVKKSLMDLEDRLSNTVRNSNGTITFASGNDEESYIGKGWKLDI